LGLKTPILEKT